MLDAITDQIQRRDGVFVEVIHRVVEADLTGGLPGKVKNPSTVIRQLVESSFQRQVACDEIDTLRDIRCIAGRQVVDSDDSITLCKKSPRNVSADKARNTRNQDLFH